MADDIWIGSHLVLIVFCLSSAVSDLNATQDVSQEELYVNLTISPRRLVLRTGDPQPLSLDCTVEGLLRTNHTVCRITLSKVASSQGQITSPSPLTHSKREPLGQILWGKPKDILTSQVDRSARGDTARGKLQMKIQNVTCATRGKYACDVMYIRGLREKEPEAAQSCNDVNEADDATGKHVSIGVTSDVTVVVPVNKVTPETSFTQTSMHTVDMFLTCSVHTTMEIDDWGWEKLSTNRKWQAVNKSTYMISSDVYWKATSLCQVVYRSTLYRELRSSYVGKRYRCWPVSEGRQLRNVSAYFNVSVTDRLFPEKHREFIETEEPETDAKVKPKDEQNRGMLYITVIPLMLGLMAVVGAAVAGYYVHSAKTAGSKHVNFKEPSQTTGDDRLQVDTEDPDEAVSVTTASDTESNTRSSVGTASSRASSAGEAEESDTGLAYLFSDMERDPSPTDQESETSRSETSD